MTEANLITEVIYRFRLEFCDDLPEAHKADYRRRGIDPDTLWNLAASFDDLQEALAQLTAEIEDDTFGFRKWRMTDNVVTRVVQHSTKGAW